MSQYDFDSEDKYTEFNFQGHTYQFWYPTIEQAMEMQTLKTDDERNDFTMDLVKRPEGAEYSEFKEVRNTMTVKQLAKFNKMISTELGLG